MKRLKALAAIAGTLGFLGLAGVAAAGEEKISAKELPRAVIKAIKAKFPKAEIEEAAREEEEGKTVYEVSLEIKERKVDVAMKPDGTILEIEKEVPVGELPKAVKKALVAKYPKAKIKKVEAITNGEDGPTNYEVVLVTEVVVSPKGKFIEADEEDEEDDEKPAAKSKKAEKENNEDKAKAKSKKAEKEDEDDKDDEGEDDDDKRAEKGPKD